MPMRVSSIEWLRLNAYYSAIYSILSVLSLGIIPIVHMYDPCGGQRMRSLDCSPEEADHVIVRLIDNMDDINPEVPIENCTTVDHFTNGKEHNVTFEVDGQRYCANNVEEWEVQKLEDVPKNFKRFLVPPTCSKDDRDLERSILRAQYGVNQMAIPIANIAEITVKHALHPLIVFGYFAVIIWAVQLYYWWALALMLTLIFAVYALTAVNLSSNDVFVSFFQSFLHRHLLRIWPDCMKWPDKKEQCK